MRVPQVNEILLPLRDPLQSAMTGSDNGQLVLKEEDPNALQNNTNHEVENSPKKRQNNTKTDVEEEDSDEKAELSEFVVYESDGSSKQGDVGEWQPLAQTTFAIDYSSVPVFLKTLRSW